MVQKFQNSLEWVWHLSVQQVTEWKSRLSLSALLHHTTYFCSLLRTVAGWSNIRLMLSSIMATRHFHQLRWMLVLVATVVHTIPQTYEWTHSNRPPWCLKIGMHVCYSSNCKLTIGKQGYSTFFYVSAALLQKSFQATARHFSRKHT